MNYISCKQFCGNADKSCDNKCLSVPLQVRIDKTINVCAFYEPVNINVFKIEINGTRCNVREIDVVLEKMKNITQNEKITIFCKKITVAEFLYLPEFTGF